MVEIASFKKALFSTNNGWFDRAFISDSSSMHSNWPAANVLDSRPGMGARFANTPAATKFIVLGLFLGQVTKDTNFDVDIVALGGLANYTGSTFSNNQNTVEVKIESAISATGPWQLVLDANSTTDVRLGRGRNVLYDLRQAGVSTTATRRQYWRFTFSDPVQNIEDLHIGTIFLSRKYQVGGGTTGNGSLLEGFRRTFRNLNVSVGRSSGAMLVHKSMQVGTVYQGSFVLRSKQEAADLEKLILGYDGLLKQNETAYHERLNWVQAFVPPDRWEAGVFAIKGYPAIGRFTDFDITWIAPEAYRVRFVFEELPFNLE